MHLFKAKGHLKTASTPAAADAIPDYPPFVVDRDALAAVTWTQRCTTRTCREEGFELVVEYPTDDHTLYPGPLFDAGSKLIRSVQEKPMLSTVVANRPTFEEVWKTNPRFRAALLEQKDPLDYGKWALRKTYNYVIPSLFIPCVARTFYAEFARALGKDCLRVLDPSSGWGDRVTGAFCSGVVGEYVGVDPNVQLYAGYGELIQLFQKQHLAESDKKGQSPSTAAASPMMKATMIMQGFEVAAPLLPSGYFDVVFTSPPFFEYEVYSPHNPKYVDWEREFYEPLVEHSLRLAKEDGIVAFHIDDTTAGKVPHAIRSRAISKFAVDVGFGKRKIAVWLLRNGKPRAAVGSDDCSSSESRKRSRSPENKQRDIIR